MVDLGDSFRACCRALGRILVSACGWLAGVGIFMASFQIYWMSGWMMYGIYHAMCSLICGMICWIGIALFHRYLSLPACTCIVWDVTLIWQCGCHTHWYLPVRLPACLSVCLSIEVATNIFRNEIFRYPSCDTIMRPKIPILNRKP